MVSIGAAAFSVYQWWSGGRSERIRAAIEVSNKYIDQAIDADRRSVGLEDATNHDAIRKHVEIVITLLARGSACRRAFEN